MGPFISWNTMATQEELDSQLARALSQEHESLLHVQPAPVRHEGVSCDICGQAPITGPRFNLRGQNYDLCEKDYCQLIPEQQASYDRIDTPMQQHDGGMTRRSQPASSWGGPPQPQRVEMLHVPAEIAGVMVEMFVDTGAQTSLVTLPFARRVGLQDRIDQRYRGVATGVGKAPFLGKLHGVAVRVGHIEFQMDLMVLGVEEEMFILGLDQMKRFKCICDLENEKLIFGGNGGVAVPFLYEPKTPVQSV